MFFADVLGEGFSLAEALSAVLAAKPFGSLVDSLVSLESGAGDETFVASWYLADVFALVGVCCFDVLL